MATTDSANRLSLFWGFLHLAVGQGHLGGHHRGTTGGKKKEKEKNDDKIKCTKIAKEMINTRKTQFK